MTILTKDSFYMNPFTGSIDTGENWMIEQIELGFSEEDLDSLIEVTAEGEEIV